MQATTNSLLIQKKDFFQPKPTSKHSSVVCCSCVGSSTPPTETNNEMRALNLCHSILSFGNKLWDHKFWIKIQRKQKKRNVHSNNTGKLNQSWAEVYSCLNRSSHDCNIILSWKQNINSVAYLDNFSKIKSHKIPISTKLEGGIAGEKDHSWVYPVDNKLGTKRLSYSPKAHRESNKATHPRTSPNQVPHRDAPSGWKQVYRPRLRSHARVRLSLWRYPGKSPIKTGTPQKDGIRNVSEELQVPHWKHAEKPHAIFKSERQPTTKKLLLQRWLQGEERGKKKNQNKPRKN